MSPQATELQQILQRQYAKKRRQSMAKPGLRQVPIKRSTKTRDDAGTKIGRLRDGQKGVTSSQRLRLKKSSSGKAALSSLEATSHNKVDAASTNKDTLSLGLQENPTYHETPECERPDLPSTDPSVKLRADVQKLKKALEADEKAKRTSKIQISNLKASKGQAHTPGKKETSKPNSTKQSSQKNASKVAVKTPSP